MIFYRVDFLIVQHTISISSSSVSENLVYRIIKELEGAGYTIKGVKILSRAVSVICEVDGRAVEVRVSDSGTIHIKPDVKPEGLLRGSRDGDGYIDAMYSVAKRVSSAVA